MSSVGGGQPTRFSSPLFSPLALKGWVNSIKKWAFRKRQRMGYLKELVDLDLSGCIDLNCLDGATNLIVRLTLANLLNDLDQVLLVDLSSSVDIETTVWIR